MSVNNSESPNVRYEAANYGGIDISFNGTISAVLSVDALMSNISSDGAKLGHVDFSKVNEVSSDGVESKTKCLAGTFGIGADSVLADMYNNLRKTLDDMALKIGEKLGIDMENYSESILASNKAAQEALEKYKENLDSFGALEDAEGSGVYLQALASIMNKTGSYTNEKGNQILLITSGNGQTYQIEFENNSILSIGILGADITSISSLSDLTIEQQNALSLIKDDTEFLKYEDGSREYHIMDSDGNSYVIQKDKDGNVTGFGNFYTTKTFNYSDGRVSNVNYLNENGDVSMKTVHNSKGGTIVYTLDEETGVMNYNNDFQEQYGKSIINSLAEQYYLMKTGQSNDLLEDYEIDYLERMNEDIERTIKACGRDGLTSYQKTFLYYKDEIDRSKQMADYRIEIAEAKNAEKAAKVAYEEALANYEEACEKNVQAMGEVESIYKDMKDAEATLELAKEKYNSAVKESAAAEERLRTSKIDSIMFNTSRESIVDGKFDGELFDSKLNNNQEYQDLRYKSSEYWADYYGELAEQNNAEATKFAREASKKSRFKGVYVILDGTEETQAEYDRQMAEWNKYKEEVISPLEQEASEWKYNADQFTSRQEQFKAEMAQALLLMPETRESIIKSYSDELDFTQIGAGEGVTGTLRVFYDKDGKEVTNCDEIAAYCVQNDIDLSTVKLAHSREYLTNLNALNRIKDEEFRSKGLDGTVQNFTTQDAVSCYFTASAKYGDNAATDIFKYFNNEGARLIGYTEAKDRIEAIRGNYNQRYDDGKKTLAALGRFGSVVADSLKHGLEGWAENMGEFFDGDGRVSALQFETQEYMNHLANDEDFKKAYYSNIYEIGSSIGNMLPSIALSAITSGMLSGGLALSAAEATAVEKGLLTVSRPLLSEMGRDALTFCTTFASMGLSAAGSTKEQAMQAGMSEGKATIYGLMSGLSETGMEMLLGSLPGIGKMEKVFDELGGVNGFFGKMLSEAIEESTQEVVDAAFNTIFTGEKFYVDPDAVLKSGIYGAITSGIMSGSGSMGRIALTAGRITTNIVIDGVVQNTTTTPAGLSYILNKYSNLTLGEKLVSQELKSDLLHLNGIRTDLSARVDELMNDADFKEIYRLYTEETTDPLSMKQFASDTAVADKIKDSQISNTIGEEIATLISEREVRMDAQRALSERIAKLQEELGIDFDSETDLLYDENGKIKNNQVTKKVANLFEMIREYSENSQKMDQAGVKIFDHYSIERDNLSKLKSDLESNPDNNTLENREKLRNLERKVKTYEEYIGDVIAQRLEINDNYDVAKTNYDFYSREREEKIKIVEENEARLVELQNKLDEANRVRKESNRIDSVLASDIEETRKEINDLQSLNDKINARIKTLNGLINSTVKTMRNYIGEDIEKIGKAQELLASELNSKRDELEIVQKRIKELEKQETDLTIERARSDSAIEYEEEIKSVKEELNNLREQSRKLTLDVTYIQETIDNNNDRLSEIDNRIVPIKSVSENSDVASTGSEILAEAVGEVIDTVKDAIKDQLADDGEDDNQEQANEAVVEKVSGDEVVVEQEELRDVNENRPDGIIKATNNENEEQPDGSIFESIFGRKNNENNTINSYDDVELDEDALEDFVGGIKDVDRVVKVTMESIDEAEAQKHQIKRSTAKNKESFLKLVPGEKTGFDFDVMELNKEQIIAEGNRVLNSVFPNGKTGWEMLYESGVSRSITTIEQLVAENGKFLDPNQNNLFVIGPNGYREAASKLGAASFISPSWGTEVYNYIFGDNSLLLYYVTGNYDAIETALKQHKTICCTADLFGKYTALEISTLENVLYNLGFECEFVPKKVTAIDNKGNAYETILYELKTKKLTISPQETVVEDTMVESNSETTASSRFLDMTKEEIVEHFTSLTDETQIAKDLEEYIGLGEYSRNVLKSIIYNKETNAMVINALCKVNDDVIEVLEDENLIHIDSFQSLSNDALVFLAEKNLISQFDYAEFAEELASRDIDMDYDKFFKEMDRRNLSILLIEMESSDLLKKLFNKASYAQLINIMNSIGKNAKQELLNSIDPNFLNYYFKNNTDYDLMLQFVDKLDAENINKLLSESDNGIYEKLSVDVLAKIYNYGNSSFIDHISNSKLYELYKTTQSSNLLEILNSDVKRQKNIKFELTRKDGSNISIELKNIIKSSDNTVFVYEINGKQVFSETNIIDMIINESENVDGLINDYLADYRLEVSKGYIGEYKEGILSYEKSNELVVNNIINSYLRSSEEFFEHMRDNNSARQFGTDQETNNTDGGNKYLDRSSGVSDDINYSSYKKMVRFFESRFNMSESTVRQTISYIINNYEGACSYANLANIILDYYKDHSIEFKKKFGFDMYTLENGKKVLNTRMLMVYIYVSCNSSDLLSTGKIFSMNEQTGERIINTVTEENGKVRKADDREQVYMSYKRGYSNEAIKFLNSIGIDCRTDVITDSFDLETTKQRIREALLNGEIVSLGEHSSSVEIDKNGKKTTITDPTQKELVFHNMDGETDTSTKEWNEGGGHITYVVGMTEDSLIVISWGNKYEIKFSDLSKDNYSIKFLSLSSAELENARTDVEIYEQISNMSADEVLGIMDSIDFDYVVKNYLSKETIKELCEKIDPWDMISKVSSARSINLIFEAYGPEMASDLVAALSDSQILTCFKSNMIPSKAILDEFERSIFSMTSDIDVLTNYINYVKDHMSSFAFASERNKFYKKNPLKYIEYICNNYSEQELKKEWPKIRENFVNYLNTNKTRKARNEFISKLETIMSPNKFNNILKVYSLISFNDFSNYMQTSRSIEEYNQFIRENYTFDKLLETYEKQNSRELLDILFENCDGTPFVEKISSEKLLLYISTKTTEELERISEKLCLTDQMVFEQAIETFNNLNNERLENSIKDVIDGLDNWIEMVAALKDNGLLTEENIIKILNSQIVKSNDSLMIAVLLESLSKPSCIEALNKFIENGTEDEVFDVIAAVNQGFTNKARNTLASKLTDKAITRIREVNSDGILEYLSEERKAEYLANIEGIDSKLNDIIDRADGNWLNMSMLLSSEGLLTEENIIKIINSEVTRKNSDLMRVVLLSSMDKQNCINEINNFIKNGSIEDVKVLATALENGLTNKARNNLIPKLSNEAIIRIMEESGNSILEFLPAERIAEINNAMLSEDNIETLIISDEEKTINQSALGKTDNSRESVMSETASSVETNTKYNLDTIKGSILSKITPEMSDLEKARLIYIELGKKVDYSSIYRYAIRNHENDALYDSEYNKKLTVEDLEKDPNVICATWAQVYSEMLIEAGFDPKSIILQRLKVDEVGSDNVYNSHVALYVLLDDGSIILPDMTIPIKQADLYNVKAGNNTTGFLLFTKKQQELLSKDYELWSDFNEQTGVRDTLYYPQIESLEGQKPVLSKVVENTIKECGNYLYGFVTKNNGKPNDIRLAHEKTFFRSINKTNAEIIANADNNIKDKLTKSDFFINEVTEEVKSERNQSAKAFFDDFSKTGEITLENLKDVANILDAALSMFGIDNVTDRNIGTLQGYLRDVASQIGVDIPNSDGLVLTIGLNNKTENNSLNINVQRHTDLGNNKVRKDTITSFGIRVNENGNFVITSKTIADKINKLFENSNKESIIKAVSALSDIEIQTLENIGVDLSSYKNSEVEEIPQSISKKETAQTSTRINEDGLIIWDENATNGIVERDDIPHFESPKESDFDNETIISKSNDEHRNSFDMTDNELCNYFESIIDEEKLIFELEEFIKSDNYTSSTFRRLINSNSISAKILNSICKIDENLVQKLKEDKGIHIYRRDYPKLSIEMLIYSIENDLIDDYELYSVFEEIKTRNTKVDYSKIIENMSIKMRKKFVEGIRMDKIFRDIFAELSYETRDKVLDNANSWDVLKALFEVDDDYLNYFIKKSNFTYSNMSLYIERLDIDNLKALLKLSNNGAHEFFSIDVLEKLYNQGDKSFIKFITNNQIYKLYKATNDTSLLKLIKLDENRQKNIIFEFNRENGSTLSVELKNIIKFSDKTIYIYEINGKQLYSETNIIDKFINESEDVNNIINGFLSEDRIEKANDYIGEFNNGEIIVEENNATEDNIIINSYINSANEFFDHMRNNNSALEYGAAQDIKRTDGRLLYLDIDKGVNDRINQESYQELVNYFSTKYNMKEETIRKTILYVVNSPIGVCAYANLTNIIFDYYKDHSIAFKKKFGFDMYEFENGKKVLNSRMLLLDIFIRCNSSDYSSSGKIFSVNPETGERIINFIIDKYGKVRNADSREQARLSWMGYTDKVENYLASYGIIVKTNSVSNVDNIKEFVRNALLKGQLISLAEESDTVMINSGDYEIPVLSPTQQEIVFHSLDGDIDISSKKWKEGAGHITYITGMTEDSLTIISWGQKYEIKFSDLQGNYTLDTVELSSSDIRNSKTDAQIYEEISQMSADEIVEIIDSYDFDYLIKNYLSEDTIKELSKLMTPEEMLSKVRSARSVELVFNAYGVEQYSKLVSYLTTEQKLLCLKSNIIPSSSIVESLRNDIYALTSNVEVITNYLNYIKNNLPKEEFSVALLGLFENNRPLYITYICDNLVDDEFTKAAQRIKYIDNVEEIIDYYDSHQSVRDRNSFTSNLKKVLSDEEFKAVLGIYSDMDFNSFADYMKNNMGIEAFKEYMANYPFDKLLKIFEKGQSMILLEELANKGSNQDIISRLTIQAIVSLILRTNSEEINNIRSKLTIADQQLLDSVLSKLDDITNKNKNTSTVWADINAELLESSSEIDSTMDSPYEIEVVNLLDLDSIDLEQKFGLKGYPKFEIVKSSILEANNIKLANNQQIAYDHKNHNFVIRLVDSNSNPIKETEKVIPRELLEEKNKADRLVEVSHKDSNGVEHKYWKDLITGSETPQDISYDRGQLIDHIFGYDIYSTRGNIKPSGLHSYDKAVELFKQGKIIIEGASLVTNEDGTVSVNGLKRNSIGTYDITFRGSYTYTDPNTGKQMTAYTPKSKQSTLFPEGVTEDEITDILDNFVNDPNKKPYSIKGGIDSAIYEFDCTIKGKDYTGVVELDGDKIGTFYLRDPQYKGIIKVNTYK